MAKNYWYDLSDRRLRDLMINKYNGKCAYCGCELQKRFHIDHIEPIQRSKIFLNDIEAISSKERHTINNMNPACAPCNISKSSFSLETWRNELQLKIDRIERDSPTFRNLKRFGLVGILKHEVKFYFETL